MTLLVTLDNVADRTVLAPATDHSSVCPINFRRYGIGLPRLSRVTGNQGSIPEREPEKRLSHPRKAARSATCRASTRVAAHSGDADETLLGRYVSDRRAVPFPLRGWGRRRSPLSMPAPEPAGGARARLRVRAGLRSHRARVSCRRRAGLRRESQLTRATPTKPYWVDMSVTGGRFPFLCGVVDADGRRYRCRLPCPPEGLGLGCACARGFGPIAPACPVGDVPGFDASRSSLGRCRRNPIGSICQ